MGLNIRVLVDLVACYGSTGGTGKKKKGYRTKGLGKKRKKGSKHGRYGMGIVARPEDGRKKRNSTPVYVCVSYILYQFTFFFLFHFNHPYQ